MVYEDNRWKMTRNMDENRQNLMTGETAKRCIAVLQRLKDLEARDSLLTQSSEG